MLLVAYNLLRESLDLNKYDGLGNETVRVFFSNSCMWHYLNCLNWTHTWREKNLLVSEERSKEEIAHVACLKGAEGNTELISFKDKKVRKASDHCR